MTQAVAQVRNVVQRSGFANPLTLGVLVTVASYVKVYADDELLVDGADYSLTGVGDTNGVEIEIIGADDPDNYVGYETFTALYDPPLDQQVDLSSGGRLGVAYEAGLDQNNRRLQALADPVSRSLRLPPNMDVDGELPWPPVDGYNLVWDEDLQQMVWADGVIGAAADAAAAAASAATAAAEAAAAAVSSGLAEDAATAAALAQAAAEAAQAAAELAAAAFPPGGTTGQLLAKNSNTDYDTEWIDGAFTADAISFTPTGGVAATDVQAAIAELDSEKLSAAQADTLFLTPAEGNAAYQPLDSDLTAIAALTTQTFGRARLTDAAAENARDALDTAPYVADRTALKALDTTKDTVAILKEAGRQGTFVFMSGDYSAQVTLDTLEGIYVKATAIASSVGAWVRVFASEINVKWFGAKGDLSQDDQPAVQCAVNVAAGRQIVAPVGQYRMNSTVSYTGIINLRGDGNGAGPGPASQSNSNVTQFIAYFSAADMFAVTSNYPSIFRDFQVNCTPANRPMTAGSAIHISGPVGSTNATSKVENVSATNFYRGVTLTRPAYPTVTGCYFDTWVGAGIYAETSSGVEGSGGFIHHNEFFGTSGSTSQGGCIVSEVGYILISNNWLLGAAFGVNVTAKNHDVGAPRIYNNVLENQGTTSIVLQTQDGSKMSMALIAHNEFSNVSFVTSFDSSIKTVDYSSGTDWLDDVLIQGNVHRHSLDANARYIWLQSGRNVVVADEQLENLGAGSGTTAFSTTFAGAALKAPFIIRDCTFLGTFAARYSVPAQVQIIEPEQASILTADRTGSDVNTAQAVFGSSEDAVTLEFSTTYAFEAVYVITRAAGSTSHTTGVLFGGTATFTSIDYLAKVSNPTGNVLGAVSEILGSAATETVLTAANTSTTENVRITLKGVMRVNGRGTVIPQFKFSAAPGGAPTIKRNSFFRCWPIGSNTAAKVGDWA